MPPSRRSTNPRAVLERYGIRTGTLERLDSGSPNACWRVATEDGDLLLKQCANRMSPDRTAFVRRAIARAREAGVPTEPLIPTVDGRGVAREGGSTWFLRRYVPGRVFRLDRPSDAERAGRILQRLHGISGLKSGGRARAGEIDAWLRRHEPTVDAACREVARWTDHATATRLGRVWRTTCRDAVACLAPPDYARLPRALSHGEFQGNNLIFQNDEIAAVIDWDSAAVRPRVFDLALATFFLTRKRRGGFVLDKGKALGFLSSYREHMAASEEELRVIIPVLQLYFLPVASYLRLMATRSSHGVAWYLEWATEGASSARRELLAVLRTMGCSV